MAEQVILDGLTAAGSGTHAATVDSSTLQIEGIGATGFGANPPRIVCSVATDGTNFSRFETFYEDGAHTIDVKTGATLKCELKDPTSATNCTVSLME